MSIYLKEKKPRQNSSSVILTTITTVFVLSLLFGAFLFGQKSGNSPAKALPTLTLSSSQTSSSTDTSVSISSSMSSASTVSSLESITNTAGKYSDLDQTSFQISYSEDWKKTTIITQDTKPLPSKTITFTHTDGSTLIYSLVGSQSGRGVNYTCLSTDQIVDLGSGWYRVRRDDGSRIYIRDPNTANPESGGLGGIVPCPSSKKAASTNGYAYVDGTDAKYDIMISLNLVSDDKTLADSIVLSTVY